MSHLKIIYTTFGSQASATEMAIKLLEGDLAACCNIIPGVQSFYHWEDKFADTTEVIMLIKTQTTRVAAVKELLEREHPYDVPGIEVLAVEEANKAFEDWVFDETVGMYGDNASKV